MAEIKYNKRGYPVTPGKSPSKDLDTINTQLERRDRPPITQEQLDRANRKRRTNKPKASIYITQDGGKTAKKVSRVTGNALIQAGKAKPINRRSVKDGKVKVK